MARYIKTVITDDLPAIVDSIGRRLNFPGKKRKSSGGTRRIGAPHHSLRVEYAEPAAARYRPKIIDREGHRLLARQGARQGLQESRRMSGVATPNNTARAHRTGRIADHLDRLICCIRE